ncbi:MAG: hypothetical protein AAGJ81_02600 [Verrucomicrobiota bacterium]
MIEAVSIPVLQIVLFLAALYAPGNAIEMEIDSEEKSMTYLLDNGVWIPKDGTENAFTIKGFRLLTPSGFTDLESVLGNLSNHNWSTESILKIDSQIEVLKTKDGLLVFPEGLRGTAEPIRVVYTMTSPPRRRINITE